MTAEPLDLLDDAATAKAFYPDAPTAAEPVAWGDPEEKVIGELFYPNTRPAPARHIPPDADLSDAEALYGGETEPEPEREPTAEADRDDTGESPSFDESSYDAAVLADYHAAVSELGIENDAAEKLLQRVGPRIAERQAEQLNALRDEWAAQVRADPELVAGLPAAQQLIREHGGPELVDLLNQSGLGDHPAVVRFVTRLAGRL